MDEFVVPIALTSEAIAAESRQQLVIQRFNSLPLVIGWWPEVGGAFQWGQQTRYSLRSAQRKGWIWFNAIFWRLHEDPLFLVYLRPSAFIGTSDMLCLMFLWKRLAMQPTIIKILWRTLWCNGWIEMSDLWNWGEKGGRSLMAVWPWYGKNSSLVGSLRSLRISWTRDWISGGNGLDPLTQSQCGEWDILSHKTVSQLWEWRVQS